MAKNIFLVFLDKPIFSSTIHPPQSFYHVSLKTDYSDEGKLDIHGDFLDKKARVKCYRAALKNAKSMSSLP